MNYADTLRELAKIAKLQGNHRLVKIYLHNLRIRRKKPVTADTVKGA